jgi:hypothetical protein
MLCAVLGTSRVSSAAPQVLVTVQAQPRFEAVASQTAADGSSELRAQLVDDTGAPLPGKNVNARPSPSSGDVQLEPCGADPLGRRAGQRMELETDAAGGVCLRVTGAAQLAGIELAFGGDGLHLPASVRAPLASAASPSRLAFDAPSLELDLDQSTQRLRLIVSGLPEQGPEPRITLSLHEGERERRIEPESWTRQEDGFAISVRSEQLGAPGPARLVAILTPGAGRTVLRAESVALKVTAVQLQAEVAALEGERARLLIESTGAGGPPTSGWVEAWLEGQSVASTPLIGGHASLELSAMPPGATHLSLRYKPEEPWWLPGKPFELTLERAMPRAPGRWPWLVLIAPIAWVCSRALQRPAPRDIANRPRRRPPVRAEVSTGAAASHSGWTGRVIDAHDGAPIPEAIVQISLPSLLATGAGTSTRSDERGVFALPALSRPLPEGARLRVSARLHTEVERALPPEGRVDIAMISRRRLLLRRLVRWARAMGAPWHRNTEPTPREIMIVALRRGEPQTARWAEDVETAAFGSSDVDVRLEAALVGQEPAWTQAGRAREDDLED